MDRQLSLLHKTALPFLLLLLLLLLVSSSGQPASSTAPSEGSAWSPHVYIIDQPPPAAGGPLSMATSPPARQKVTLIFVVGMIVCAAIFSVTYFIAYRTIFVTRREWNPNYTYRSRRRRSSNGEAPPQEYGSEDGQGGSSTGLAASLLSSFPIIQYSSAMAMKELAQHTQLVVMKECAVCLSEYAEGEDMKLLPVCGHSFHRACIDMWLFSHTTCPVCRLSLLVKQAAGKNVADRTPPSAST